VREVLAVLAGMHVRANLIRIATIGPVLALDHLLLHCLSTIILVAALVF
jgi:hypothetical protein